MASVSLSDAKPRFENVAAFVKACGGKRVIKRVLIANNGIAAVKAIRSIRRWAYETFGNEREILFTVMATPQDLHANAEYIRMADSFVEVPGGSNNNNYANVRLILETAESVGADAVWAGWGHASENPALPDSLLHAARPIVFIGPPAGPMHALGDKIGSTIIAQSAGVPCISWNGKDLKVNYAKDGLPADVYEKANVRTAEEAQRLADQVGYPLMVKASEGGGGKGIRKVTDPAQLQQCFRQVQGEVPGSPIFLMRLAPRSRHLEVQLLADEYGNAIALFGRDCSVQRRHQKIVEEGPVLAAPPETWSQMEKAAVRLAKEVGYVNAGTVEYLWLEDDGSFAFLELNPRLQVEHPVTEMVTGVNLPAAQLQVAMGIPLAHIADVRRLYGRDVHVDVSTGPEAAAAAKIDFDNEQRQKPQGHVIAARITAENPDSGFQPTSGAVTELNFRSTPDVWGYFSVDSSGRVHEFADSQIGHLFAWGSNREDARQHMVLALKELSIRGDIRTTVEYLVHMMESADFRGNRINTSWLDERISAKVPTSKPDPLLVAMLGAVWRSHAAYERRRLDFLGNLERGQHPPPSLLSVDDNIELIYEDVKYTLHSTRSSPSTITLACNGSWVQADFRPLSDGGLLVSLGGRAHVAYAKEEPSGMRLVLDGATCSFTNEYDPTQLRAAISCKLVRYLVEDGAFVKAGAPYAEVEAMKMYMPLTVQESGTVHAVKSEGSVLEAGDLVARVTLEDPSKVRRAEPFTGVLPQLVQQASAELAASSEEAAADTPGPAAGLQRYARRWHLVARNAMRVLSGVLQGYVVPRDVYDAAWFDRDAAFAAPELACLEVEEVMSVLASRLPPKLTAAIQAILAAHKEAAAGNAERELDVTPIDAAILEQLGSTPSRDVPAFTATVGPLREVVDRFRDGVAGASRASLHALLSQYLAVERLYSDGRRPEDVLSDLRTAAGGDKDALGRVYDTCRAHRHLKQRNILVLSALARIAEELELSKNSAAASAAALAPSSGRKSADAAAAPASAGAATDPRSPLRQSFAMSVSSRSLGSELDAASEREGAGSPSRPEDADVEDADALDITRPEPVKVNATAQAAVVSGSATAAAAGSGRTTELRGIMPLLHALAELRGVEYAEVTLEARQMLIVQQLPSQGQRRKAVETLLRAMGAPTASRDTESVREDAMNRLVDDGQPLLDVLMSFFAHPQQLLRHNAVEVYVRRLYRLYSIRSLEVVEQPGAFLGVYWTFSADVHSEEEMSRVTSRRDSYDEAVVAISDVESLHEGSNTKGSALRPGLAMADSYADLSSARSPVPAAASGSRSSRDVLALNGNELPAPSTLRRGAMAAFASVDGYTAHFHEVLQKLAGADVSLPAPGTAITEEDKATQRKAAVNVVHLSLLRSPTQEAAFRGAAPLLARVESGGVASVADTLEDDEALEKRVMGVLADSLTDKQAALLAAGVRRVSFNVPHPRDSSDRNSTTHTPLHDAAAGFVAAVHLFSAGGESPSVAAMPFSRLRSADMLGGDAARAGKGAARGAVVASTRQAGAISNTFQGGFPWVYTFRAMLGYGEDSIVRHIEPPASANLELKRLSNFKVRHVPTPNRVVHVYAAEPREGAGGAGGGAGGEEGSGGRGTTRVRYFVRAIVRQTARIPTLDSVYEQYPGPERMFVECLDALNIAMGNALADTTLPVGNNHIFLNVLPVAQVRPEYIETVIKILARRYADRLRRLRVSQVEFKINVQTSPSAAPIAIRLISSNPTGYVLRVDTYVEARDDRLGVPIFTSIAPGAIGSAWTEGGISRAAEPEIGVLASLGLSAIRGGFNSFGSSNNLAAAAAGNSAASVRGELDGKPVTTPYPVTSAFERQRALAAALTDTVYVYDFIELLTRALEIEWSRYEKQRGVSMPVRRPRSVLSAVELILRPRNRNGAAASGGSHGDSAATSTPGTGGAGMRRNPSVFIDQFSNEMSIGGRGAAEVPPSSPMESGNGLKRGMSARVTESPPGSASSSASSGPASAGSAASKAAFTTDAEYELVETTRPAGQNDIGMVAWRITMYTPQYGEESGGRQLVLIANDITFRAGSFGTAEDRLFHLASAFARERGMPRVYLAANSGARIGLAEELKKLFRVAWTDPAEPSKGFKYVYLTPADYHALCAAAAANSSGRETPVPPVIAHRLVEEGEERWVVTDIIGRETDLGVENLRGSGTIAGETARAYQESFTLTYVTGRTVGIGAYLVRLGHRCIQKVTSAPIILTGYEALNKLMGQDVYTSNIQLGGPKIMYNNGVSHEVVDNDFEGVLSILRWLAFVPRVKGAPLPITDVTRGDEPDRDIEFAPPSSVFDPRLLMTGVYPDAPAATAAVPESPRPGGGAAAPPAAPKWVSGFCDRDSFREALGGWARSVVVGRARLGGIPIGIIIPELRSVQAVAPADPASPASKENVVAQAGQVWYPDSAFKTAQAIRDFSGEDLPIFIFANWRGFSGGQRDMFNEVLKFGSYIVDALVACKQPVFVYIPPGGELRGGAWVVVDPTINADVMEMYSDPTGRGGVLEPSGTAAIKFRARELVATAHRLDPALKDLDEKLRAAVKAGQEKEAAAVKKAIRAREDALSGVYLQIAHTFADLHDTPGRMQAKGTIHGVVPWARARSYFYWRLRRKLAENSLVRRFMVAAPQLNFSNATQLLKQWYFQALAAEGARIVGEAAETAQWRDDKRVLRWLADTRDSLEARAHSLRRESISEQVLSLGMEDASAVVTGVLAMVARLPPDRRESVIASLRRGVIFGGNGGADGAAAWF